MALCRSALFSQKTRPYKYNTCFLSLLVMSRPLTHENLARIERLDRSKTPLARYCHDLSTMSSSISLDKNTRKDYHSVRSTTSNRSQTRFFPFHNDSTFLPVSYEECHQSQYASSLEENDSSTLSDVPTKRWSPSQAKKWLSNLKRKDDSPRWITRSWTKLFRKKNKPHRMTENSPVWYSQFTSNPPPPPGLLCRSNNKPAWSSATVFATA